FNREAAVQAARRRHFRVCWIALAMIVTSALLPGIVGLIGNEPWLALAGVIWLFAPMVIYLLGMLQYAAALFEWRILFESRKGRLSRAWWDDNGARKVYLFGGLLMMVPSSLASVVGSVVI